MQDVKFDFKAYYLVCYESFLEIKICSQGYSFLILYLNFCQEKKKETARSIPDLIRDVIIFIRSFLKGENFYQLLLHRFVILR